MPAQNSQKATLKHMKKTLEKTIASLEASMKGLDDKMKAAGINPGDAEKHLEAAKLPEADKKRILSELKTFKEQFKQPTPDKKLSTHEQALQKSMQKKPKNII